MSELYSLLEDFREDYRHNPSFGSIILEDLYTSSGRIIILPIGGYLHILTFLSELNILAPCHTCDSSTLCICIRPNAHTCDSSTPHIRIRPNVGLNTS